MNLKFLDTHIGESNLWFLKLTKLNRGRGIYVFNGMEQLISLLNECTGSIKGSCIVRDYMNLIININSDFKG